MSEDNTAIASMAKINDQDKRLWQNGVAQYCTRAGQLMANINNLLVDSDRIKYLQHYTVNHMSNSGQKCWPAAH